MNVVRPDSNEVGGNVMKTKTKSAPAMNSTSGYCQEILDLHFLQAPFCTVKLNIGMSSFQVSVVPQDMHLDLPPMPVPVLKRRDTTFKKLPITVPNMNERMRERLSIRACYFGPRQK